MKKTVIIIGAGAAGMMTAITAAKQGAEVTVLEKNSLPCRKLRITGKGRCNITNDCTVQEFLENVPRNNRFLYSAANLFSPKDAINFFEDIGVRLKTERGRRVFPMSDSAAEISSALEKKAKLLNVKILNETVSALIIENNVVKGIKTKSGIDFFADSIIVATGGKSYPKTGSSGDGYTLARQAEHTIMPIRPSLVPLESTGEVCAELQGLSLKNVSLKIFEEGNKTEVYTDFGELLFTHFGLSGPMILSASAHLRAERIEKYRAHIDLKPALTAEQLDARILRDFQENLNKDFQNSLSALLPKSIIPVIIRKSGISPQKKCNEISKTERITLGSVIKSLEIKIKGFRPIDEAIITSGGVNTKEINPKTMESKLCKGLYFAGEVIDCDAYTGGYNLQIAWSTGFAAAMGAVSQQK